MNKPLITVVIPAHNEEDKIETSLRSMMTQTYENLEILVIDDHSDDNTKDVVLRLAKEDPRITYRLCPYIDTKRKNWRGYDINGGYLARNFAFEIAKGEYIVLHDADDSSFANRIEAQYNLMQKYNATMVGIQWMQYKPEYEGKILDVDAIFRDKGEDVVIVRPETINKLVSDNKGLLMRKWFPHTITPFMFKWFPPTRRLWFKKLPIDTFPGADNSLMFKAEVVKQVQFRQRDKRVWPAPSGRGSGRDFAFQVTETFGNSWVFKLPIYLWRATSINEEFVGYEKYIK